MQLHLAGGASERRAGVGIALEGVVCRRWWRGLAASAAVGAPTFAPGASISSPRALRCAARSCCCRRPRTRRTGPKCALWRQGLVRATRDRQRRGANQERQTSELRPAPFWKASCSGAFQHGRRPFGNQRHPRPLAKIPLPIPDIGDLVEAKMTRENTNRKTRSRRPHHLFCGRPVPQSAGEIFKMRSCLRRSVLIYAHCRCCLQENLCEMTDRARFDRGNP